MTVFFDDVLSFLHAEIEYIQLCLKYPPVAEIKSEIKENKPKTYKATFPIRWTANKIDLVELIYTLYHAKCISEGNVNIKVIVEAFEQFFNVDLGKYYRTYTDVTRRKINRSKFLNNLINVIENEFIEIDRK